jgi:hypothetical protein
MKAKLVREIPQREGLPYYFKTYEYECIECGEHFTRHQYNKRITPYCCKCNAKYEKQKQKERVARHEQKIINAVLDKIRAEIYEHFMTIDGGVHDKSAIKCMQIIDHYMKGE